MTNGEYILKVTMQDESYCILRNYETGTVTLEVSLEWWNKSRAENDIDFPQPKDIEPTVKGFNEIMENIPMEYFESGGC